MITIFCDFSQFSAKKLAFFTNTNVMINFLHNLALFWAKKCWFYRKIFRWKYLKNLNIGPCWPVKNILKRWWEQLGHKKSRDYTYDTLHTLNYIQLKKWLQNKIQRHCTYVHLCTYQNTKGCPRMYVLVHYASNAWFSFFADWLPDPWTLAFSCPGRALLHVLKDKKFNTG
jgi:hypothetical protein